MKKRIVSLLLTLLTILSLLPTAVMAAESTGVGITPVTDPNPWTTRLNSQGQSYSYRPPTAAGRQLYCMDLGYCTREAMNVPSGERYELCRSVHAEMNAIISAARRDTLGATLYLAGREAKSGELLHDATSCSMCRRLIINAGIDRVVIRNTEREYSVVHVEDWVREDDSLPQQV